MVSDKQFRALKRKADEYAKEVSRMEGALDQMLSRLKDEFDCDSLEEAEAKRDKMIRARDKHEKKLDRMLKEFEQEWGHVLSEKD